MSSVKPAVVEKELKTLISFKEFKIINGLLEKSSALLTTATPEKMITYVKTTFPVKDKLSSWTLYVNNVQKELDGRGLNSKELLKDLI